MKKILFCLILLFWIALPCLSLAADVNVSAVVDSKVSKTQSDVGTNATQTLADPASHSILLTITLKDAAGNPMPNIPVVVTSSRGQVDIIEAVSKISFDKSPNHKVGFTSLIGEFIFSRAHAAEVSDLQKDITDKNGQVQFRVTSFIAGDAIFYVLADTLINLDPIKVTFEPLPFPTNVTISMSNPFTGKEIVLYEPKESKGQIGQGLSGTQMAAKELVNTGTKVQISFWALAIPILLLILCPFFIILSFINLRKMRWMEQEQVLLLKKMFPPDYNRQAPRQS